MHRAYHPILPTHSKLLQQRWDSNYYDEHRRKVASAKSQVDTRPPVTYMHLHLKLKKLQVEEERLAVIDKDNRILLSKMADIMKTTGRIENRNDYEYRSLNREKRLREILQVTKENERILKGISSKKPEYDHTKWDRDWATNQQFMDQISAYPKDWCNRDRTNSAASRPKSCASRPKSSAARSKSGAAAGQKKSTVKQENSEIKY